MAEHLRVPGFAPIARRTDAAVAVPAATLALAFGCWLIAARGMSGMDMGVETELGPFWPFVGVWVAMMAAMMLPGAAPVIVRQVGIGGVRAVPLFVASYLAVWTLVGIASYPLYRPHGTLAAGAVLIAAGLYESTPLKQEFRRRCRAADIRSGFHYGLCCVGSSIGLMQMLLTLGAMSVPWMFVIAVIVTVQKLVPAKPTVDVPLALAIVGLGAATVLAPAWAGWF